jgi:hypothetical protein
LQFGIFGASWLCRRLERGESKQKQTVGKIMPLNTPDLTKFPPRSPRVRLGGYVILPRCLDKGRATVAGKQGEYHYACPLDQRFLEFAGIDPEALKKELGKSDGEILEWINANAKNKKTMPEILAWSCWQENLAPNNPEGREFFNGLHKNAAPKRTDIANWFDVLDVDDFVSFGGKA